MVRISACNADDSTVPGDFFGVDLELDNDDRNYHSVDYELLLDGDTVATESDTVVGPGERITQTFSIVAPDIPGDYQLEAQITRDETLVNPF